MNILLNLKRCTLLSLLFVVFLTMQLSAQTIPATNGTADPCMNCVPPGWTSGAGTPDISNSTQAAAGTTAGGGALWTENPDGGGSAITLPLPPNAHTTWLSLRDIGSAGPEESVYTTLSGLTPGRVYEVALYALTATTKTAGSASLYYAPRYIDKFSYEVVGATAIIEVDMTSEPQKEWIVKRLRFTASATSHTLYIRPGRDTVNISGHTRYETIQLSVTLNAVNTVPVAQNDAAATLQGTPVNINILDNDTEYDAGQSLVPGSVDLDPATPGIQSTLTTAQGTWTVDGSGVVTFAPASGFIGTASLSYTVQDNYTLDGSAAPATSNPATINVTVTACPEPVSYDYISKQNGSYTSGSTWEGGVAPNGSNKNILIKHTVTAGSDFKPNSGSTIVIKDGGHLKAGQIQTDNSNTKFILNGGYLETTNGNLQITTSSSSICAVNSCILVDGNFQFEESGTSMYFEGTGIEVKNGNLQSEANVTGSDIRVKLKDGNFERNGGTWAGSTISAWYASGGQSGFSGLPPMSSSSMIPCNVMVVTDCPDHWYGITGKNLMRINAADYTQTVVTSSLSGTTNHAVAWGADGYLYYVPLSSGNMPMYKYDPATNTNTSTGISLPALSGGQSYISGASDRTGNLYFLSGNGSLLIKINPATGTQTTLWSTAPVNFGGSGVDIGMDANDNLYFVGDDNGQVWKVAASAAGSTAPVYQGTIGYPSQPNLTGLSDIWFDKGEMFVSVGTAGGPGIYHVDKITWMASKVGGEYYYHDVAAFPCCNAGTTAPPVQNLNTPCPATTVNLDDAHTGTVPAGAELRWYNNSNHTGMPLSGAAVSAAGAGTYYAFYYDGENDCWSPAAAVVVMNNCTCEGTQTEYRVDVAATLAQNTIAPNGGTLNLVFSRYSGLTIPGVPDTFTVPVTYSAMNNTTGTGAVNQWELLAVGTGSLDGFISIVPTTTRTSGGIYHNLPNKNKATLTHNVNTDNTDKLFHHYTGNGTIDKIGNFTIDFGNFPNALPAGVSVLQQQMLVRQVGNHNKIESSGTYSSGYFLKPDLQTDLQSNTSASTNPFEVQPGQAYTYWYSAFDDDNAAHATNAGVRGAGISGSLILCYNPNSCVTGDCNPNTFINSTDPNTLEYDNLLSVFHSSIVRESDGTVKVWGPGALPDGYGETGNALTPTEVSPANGYAYTGSILRFTAASNEKQQQFAILTTDGLYSWGNSGQLLHADLQAQGVFTKLEVGTYNASGNIPDKGDGLPSGVVPTDVKMLFGTRQGMALVTCIGEAWVLSTIAQLYGDGAAGSDANHKVWHRVHASGSNPEPLGNVVAVRGAYRNFIALTASGELYTWGTNTYLGDGTNHASRSYATQMTKPAGVTPKMIGMTRSATAAGGGMSYYLLATDGKLYSMGANDKRQLGDGTTTTRNTWGEVIASDAGASLGGNVAYISPQEHDGNDVYAAINVLTTDGKLWAWGSNHAYMLGIPGGSGNYNPTYMPGRITGPHDATKLNETDELIAVETGGHTTIVIKKCTTKFGYVGHRVHGSMADGTTADEHENIYNFSETAVLDVCGALTAPVIPEELKICPDETISLTDLEPASLPGGITGIQWYHDAAGTNPVADPSAVGVGTYYAFYELAGGNNHHCPSILVVSYYLPEEPSPCDNFCVKPGAPGTPTLSKVGISTKGSTPSVTGWPEVVPNGYLVLDAAGKGFVITHITTAERDALTPVEGMMIYNVDEDCVQIYRGLTPGVDSSRKGWNCLERGCNDSMFAIDCTNVIYSGDTEGPDIDLIITVPYHNGNGSSYAAQTLYPISAPGDINGYIAAGNLTNGNGVLYIHVTGTIYNGGGAWFQFEFNGDTCEIELALTMSGGGG